MKKINLLILALLYSFCSLAQTRVQGKITGENNQPVSNATVNLKSKTETISATAAVDGKFVFENVTIGKYELTATATGYLNFSKNINVTGKELTIDLLMASSVIQLQTVEVIGRSASRYNSDYSFSATKTATLNKDIPQSVSTVTKELIADRQAFQLADAVKIVSGVTPSSYYNQYNIRGISQNEEGQIINGMRTRQYYFLQPLTTNIERVEVIKGPASATFASVDPGGSINMVTKKPLKTNRKEINLSAGSFSTIRGSLDFTGPINESKTLLYRLNTAYQEARSYRDLIGNKSILVSPSISYIPNEKTAINAEMIFNHMNGNLDRGQPIFGAVAGVTDLKSTPTSMNLAAPNDFFTSKELIIMGNLVHQFPGAISFNASYMKQTWTEDLQEHRTNGAFAPDIDNKPVTSLAAMQFIQRKQHWNIDNLFTYFNIVFNTGKINHKLLVGYDLNYWHKLKGGGQNSARGFLLNDGTVANSFVPANAANYQTITYNGQTLPKPNVNHFDLNNPTYTIRNIEDYTINSRISIPPALTTNNAIYIQEQFQFDRFTLLLSLRNEWFKDITNYKTNKQGSFKNERLLPRIGITYAVNKSVNIYATYLQGFQPQSNTVSLMPSTGNFFWADISAAQFKPLVSDLKEVGLKADLFNKRLSLTLAVYEINQKNILMNANDPSQPDLLVQRGADRSRGFEIDLAGYIMPGWQVNASYSFIDAEIVEDANKNLIGSRKENTPKNSANLWTRYNFKNTSWLKDLAAGLGVQHQGSKVPWFTRDFEVPAFTIFDAALYYTPSNTSVQVALNIGNLFNATYWVGAQNYLRLFPGAPRNATLTLTYKF